MEPFLASKVHPLCPRCQYDVHGLSEPRCPECGATFTLDQAYLAAGAEHLKPYASFYRRRLMIVYVVWGLACFAWPRVFADTVDRVPWGDLLGITALNFPLQVLGMALSLMLLRARDRDVVQAGVFVGVVVVMCIVAHVAISLATFW